MINSKTTLSQEALHAAHSTCSDENVAAAQSAKQIFANFLDHVEQTSAPA
jgi:hypothetical protein